MTGRHTFSVWLLSALVCAAAEPGNVLPNGGFETVDAKGVPTGWHSTDYRTGGQAGLLSKDAHDGTRCVVLSCKSDKERAAWRQKRAWPAGASFLACGGWYRTAGMKPHASRGPSVRVLFHRSLEKWDEIGLKHVFFPAAADWQAAKAVIKVPEGTHAVVVEFFHFFAAGETRWDDVWTRPATDAEIGERMTTFEPGTELDRTPVPGRNKPYSPADGERVTLNPPPFLWLPSGKDAHYRLQVSTSKDFVGDALIQTNPGAWCCEMLTRKLESGDWFWRYGVDRDGLPTVWSHVRAFHVPEDASPWVYPGRDSFQVAAERPRMFVRPQGLAALRQRARDGDLRKMADALVRRVIGYAGEELVPEPDFLPKGPARGPAYTLTFRKTRPPMDRMEQAGLAYLLTGNAQCGAEAKRRVLHFFAWDPRGSTNVFHNDEPAMWIMMRGTRAYDWTHDLFSAAEREKVEASMRIRAAEFYRKMRGMPFENRPFESHAGRIIGFLGEAAVSFLPDWPEAREWLDYITKIYWGVYPAWSKDDGGWNEGPGYWSAYMQFGLHFVVALREATGVDISQRPFFKATPYYKLYVSPPYSNMSPFGDGTQFRPSRPTSLLYWFSTLNRDPRIRWYPDALGKGPGSGILDAVLRDDSLRAQPPYDLPQARLFDGVGLACLHTDFGNGDNDVTFVMRSSPYGAVSHGHNDQNCFMLEAHGEPLAIASGYYNRYSSPHHDKWTRQTKAKNGITYDGGKSQDRGWHARGRIETFVNGETIDLITGDATEAYGGRLERVRRDVVHLQPGIFVIRDDMAGSEPHRFEYWLHAIDKMTLDEDAQTVLIQRPNAALHTQFVGPRPLAFRQTDQFDVPPTWPPDREYENNWHFTASAREPRAEDEFLSVLTTIKTSNPRVPPTAHRVAGRNGAGVELIFPDGTRALVGFRNPALEGVFTVRDVTCDGNVFAVRYTADGKPESWLLGLGTSLKAGRVPLAATTRPCSLAVHCTDDGGRLDVNGPGTSVAFHSPSRPEALTLQGDLLPMQAADGQVLLSAPIGRSSILVWNSPPTPPGPVAVPLLGTGRDTVLEGRRFGRGEFALSGLLAGTAGAFQPDLPQGTTLEGGTVDSHGRVWMKDGERLAVRGRDHVDSLTLKLVKPAAVLAGSDQGRLPQGVSYEAEANWSETGGAIRVSGGGHKNTSGKNNLWAWNTPGHTLAWEIDVAESTNYAIWLVCSSETGLLAEFAIDDDESSALWFEATGGWGRTRKSEWQAFRVDAPDGAPALTTLTAGKHRIALTNRSGMGLNIDRIVLVKR